MNTYMVPRNNAMFLHELWKRSAQFRIHKAVQAKCRREGKPVPRIPDEVLQRFIITRDDLQGPLAETRNKLVPKERSNGEVVRDLRGLVVFKRAKARSARSCCEGIMDLYVPNIHARDVIRNPKDEEE